MEMQMNIPNVVGFVTEFVEDRKALLDESGETYLGPTEIKLKLRLRNTLGVERVVWVEGPSDLADFFNSDLPVA